MLNTQSDTVASLMLQTPDLAAERLAELRRLFPDLFDGEGNLKPDELRQLTGESVHNRENYEFTWNGKSHAKANAYRPATATLTQDEIRSINPDQSGGNLIIEGENLESLKCLLAAYRDSIKCIYLDPPYNTGNDFVYSDDYSESRKAYWEDSGQMENGVKLDTNPETAGRYHSNWLSMMYPRLLISRYLLRDDGVIFVSIDDHEVHNLRRLMDEVFGEENFIAQMIWEGANKNTADQIGTDHEYVLLFAKQRISVPKTWKLSKEGVDLILREVARLKEKHGENFDAASMELAAWYRANKATSSFAHRRFRYIDAIGAYKEDDPTAPGGRKFKLINPETKQEIPLRANRGWAFSQEEFDRLVKEGRISFITPTSIMVRRYLHETDYSTPQSVFYQPARSASERLDKLLGGSYFSYPKDETVIRQFIEMATDPEDENCIVLDFFAGSGTTAHALFEQNQRDGGNRKFILVQIPEQTPENSDARKAGYLKISDITIERVKRVIQGYGDDPKPLDAGFRVFRLTQSHFPRAYFAPDPDKSEAENVTALKAYIAEKEKQLTGLFTPADIIDEVLLKNGFKLHYTLADAPEFAANKVWLADDGERSTLLCLDLKLQPATVGALLKTPQAFICLERALDTADKWNLRNHLGHLFTAF